jgi:pyruvate ferredoxin oxidoreductase alpha subunit
MAVGIGGIVSDGVRKALSGIQLKGYTVIAGLGGRAITRQSLLNLFGQALRDELDELSFLDLDWDIVNRELARGRQQRRAGPTAENILRDLGQVAAKIA